MNMNVTHAQKNVLDAIKRLTAESKGVAPTYKEIGRALGIAGPSVYEHIQALERKNLIATERGSARSIRLVESPEARMLDIACARLASYTKKPASVILDEIRAEALMAEDSTPLAAAA